MVLGFSGDCCSFPAGLQPALVCVAAARAVRAQHSPAWAPGKERKPHHQKGKFFSLFMPSLPCVLWFLVRKMPKAESRLSNVIAQASGEKTRAQDSVFVCLDPFCHHRQPFLPELRVNTPALWGQRLQWAGAGDRATALHCSECLPGRKMDRLSVCCHFWNLGPLTLAFCLGAPAYPGVCFLVLLPSQFSGSKAGHWDRASTWYNHTSHSEARAGRAGTPHGYLSHPRAILPWIT